MTKELDAIFDALAKRLNIKPESPEAVALDTAKLQVQMLWVRAAAASPTASQSLVKVKRGKKDAN